VIKRVVAVPGDSVAFTPNGNLVLNGQQQEEPYILECPGGCGLPVPAVVPSDHYFLAGDNRPESSDSRFWGAVPREAIDGQVAVP
jgi:signal peptidase I